MPVATLVFVRHIYGTVPFVVCTALFHKSIFSSSGCHVTSDVESRVTPNVLVHCCYSGANIKQHASMASLYSWNSNKIGFVLVPGTRRAVCTSQPEKAGGNFGLKSGGVPIQKENEARLGPEIQLTATLPAAVVT